jgi:hypothetical protein
MKQELNPPRAMIEQDIEPFERTAAAIDQAFHGMVARVTNVLSPSALGCRRRGRRCHTPRGDTKKPMSCKFLGIHPEASDDIFRQ